MSFDSLMEKCYLAFIFVSFFLCFIISLIAKAERVKIKG